jgi:hypothetical protein
MLEQCPELAMNQIRLKLADGGKVCVLVTCELMMQQKKAFCKSLRTQYVRDIQYYANEIQRMIVEAVKTLPADERERVVLTDDKAVWENPTFQKMCKDICANKASASIFDENFFKSCGAVQKEILNGLVENFFKFQRARMKEPRSELDDNKRTVLTKVLLFELATVLGGVPARSSLSFADEMYDESLHITDEPEGVEMIAACAAQLLAAMEPNARKSASPPAGSICICSSAHIGITKPSDVLSQSLAASPPTVNRHPA